MILDLPLNARLLIAPSYFSQMLAIGAGQIPIHIRLRVACHLTWLLLRPRPTRPRHSPASAFTP